MLFSIGDYLAGILIGVATTLVVRSIVSPGMDMVLAMLIGMAAGMIVHLPLGLILSPLVGMFETMMPASLIGMYGGMLFGMRDSMAAGPSAPAKSLAFVVFAADKSCLSSLRNSARTARADWVIRPRPAFSASAASCGRARSSSTDGISRRRADGLGCSFAAGSAGGGMAKVFEHSVIRAGNRLGELPPRGDFPLRHGLKRES